MRLVKVTEEFYTKCKLNDTAQELMENEMGRPCVLLLNLEYRGIKREFVVPLRSNISGTAPKWQYLSLPPNAKTKPGKRHGVHYIKLFPISDAYINKYVIDGDDFLIKINDILHRKQNDIVEACQNYLVECESGNIHSMTPNIDGIISWLDAE